MTIADITHPEDLAADFALFAEVLAGTRDTYTMDKRYVRKDGGIVWGHLAVSVTRGEDGAPETLIGMVLDITERKRAERAAEELAWLRDEQAEEAEAMSG